MRLAGSRARIAASGPRLKASPKRAEQFYQSPEWKALRSQRMRDPDYRAAKARAKDGERVILDHVVERKDGGAPLDPKNTQWLTFSEHQAKTEASKRKRVGLA
jgi:hypothetical protein